MKAPSVTKAVLHANLKDSYESAEVSFSPVIKARRGTAAFRRRGIALSGKNDVYNLRYGPGCPVYAGLAYDLGITWCAARSTAVRFWTAW
jgi:hypothetical protein